MREWLADRRRELKYTQAEVAAASQISQPSYCDIENGKKAPRPRTAKRIADVLKFPWTDFFEK